ncbi:hypothetical protein KI387_008126, partial [Taxus chinensis]
SLQWDIQCLNEKSKQLEKNKNAEAPKEYLDEVKEVCSILWQENIILLLGEWMREKVPCTRVECERKVLNAYLPPHSLDYDKEITLNGVVDGWILSNMLINMGVE